MRFDDHFRTLARTWRENPVAPWWERAAADAIMRGAFRVIPSRDGTQPYLLRCWLTPALPSGAGEVFESGDSVLLHLFLQADDDHALHSHPWAFSTTILSGGYLEALPPDGWFPADPGPAIEEWRTKVRLPGDRVDHLARDCHAVAYIHANTWTLVRTGPKERTWFFHPPGERPVPWREFLDRHQVPA